MPFAATQTEALMQEFGHRVQTPPTQYPGEVAPASTTTVTTATTMTTSASSSSGCVHTKLGPKKEPDKVQKRVLTSRNSDPTELRKIIKDLSQEMDAAADCKAADAEEMEEEEEELVPDVAEAAQPQGEDHLNYWDRMELMFQRGFKAQESSLVDKLEHMRIQIECGSNKKLKSLDDKLEKTAADLKQQIGESTTKMENLAARVERLESGEGRKRRGQHPHRYQVAGNRFLFDVEGGPLGVR